MDRLIYIGPDLIFRFIQKRDTQDSNYYDAIVKAGTIKFSVVVQFECLQAKYKGLTDGSQVKVSPVECSMGIAICSVAGPPVSLENMNKALGILTVNSKQAAEVCCQAFLKEFLDSDF